jgi:hypothetical protein
MQWVGDKKCSDLLAISHDLLLTQLLLSCGPLQDMYQDDDMLVLICIPNHVWHGSSIMYAMHPQAVTSSSNGEQGEFVPITFQHLSTCIPEQML